MKLKYKIDYKGLEEYLNSISYKEIEMSWSKPENPKLIQGHSINDIILFGADKNKYKPDSIIENGEPFLLDASGNDLTICILSKKKYRLPNGRVISAKFVTTVVDDCRKIYGSPLNGYWNLNGYWKIPSQFIQPLEK